VVESRAKQLAELFEQLDELSHGDNDKWSFHRCGKCMDVPVEVVLLLVSVPYFVEHATGHMMVGSVPYIRQLLDHTI